MRYGHTLLAGLGWAGTLGGLALCVLIFLSASVAFDDESAGVKPREDEIIRLPSVPEADVPRVPLGRPAREGGVSPPPVAAEPSPAATSPPAGTGRPPAARAADTLGDTVGALTPPAPP